MERRTQSRAFPLKPAADRPPSLVTYLGIVYLRDKERQGEPGAETETGLPRCHHVPQPGYIPRRENRSIAKAQGENVTRVTPDHS